MTYEEWAYIRHLLNHAMEYTPEYLDPGIEAFVKWIEEMKLGE